MLLCGQCYIWTMALGFSLAFGAMFSKTWRVHKIFTNKKIQRMVSLDRSIVAALRPSLLLACFPSSQVSTSGFSPSIAHQLLQFSHTESYEWHFFHRFHRLTTLIIHHLRSFIPDLKPLFSANPSHCSLLFFFTTDPTDSPDCFLILLSISVFTF